MATSTRDKSHHQRALTSPAGPHGQDHAWQNAKSLIRPPITAEADGHWFNRLRRGSPTSPANTARKSSDGQSSRPLSRLFWVLRYLPSSRAAVVAV